MTASLWEQNRAITLLQAGVAELACGTVENPPSSFCQGVGGVGSGATWT
jgi:hypothetical protein